MTETDGLIQYSVVPQGGPEMDNAVTCMCLLQILGLVPR